MLLLVTEMREEDAFWILLALVRASGRTLSRAAGRCPYPQPRRPARPLHSSPIPSQVEQSVPDFYSKHMTGIRIEQNLFSDFTKALLPRLAAAPLDLAL